MNATNSCCYAECQIQLDAARLCAHGSAWTPHITADDRRSLQITEP